MASTTSLVGPNLVIDSAATASNASSLLAEAEALCIYCPATITNTVKVQVSPDADDTATASITWYDLYSSGATITMTINACITITSVGGFRQLRLLSSGAESQEDIFKVTLQVRNY